MQLIDSHLHIWSQDEQSFPVGPEGGGPQTWDASVETLIGYMDLLGIERVVAINPRRYLLDQRYMLDAVARFPNRVIPAARVHANDPEAVSQLHDLASNHGVHGIRPVWYGDSSNDWPAEPAVEPVWQACAELGITIGLMSKPEEIAATGAAARNHPQVHVVVDHWGGLRSEEKPDFTRFSMVAPLADIPNVFLKATCFRRLSGAGFPFEDVHPLLRRALDAFGRERVMWGTDFGGGVKSGKQYVEEINAVKDHLDWLSSDDKEWLLRRTALAAWSRA